MEAFKRDFLRIFKYFVCNRKIFRLTRLGQEDGHTNKRIEKISLNENEKSL